MERLETIPWMTGVEEGLAARIHDPLWMLTRQYQFGEFTSENAPSVAWVDVKAEYHRLDRFSVGVSTRPYDATAEPLERLVEEEPMFKADHALRVEGGVRWARLLQRAGRGDLLSLFASRMQLEFEAPSPSPVALARRRLPDGYALFHALFGLRDGGAAAADAFGIPSDARDDVLALVEEWLAWWEARHPGAVFENGPLPPGAWNTNRMEHEFELSSSTLPGVRLQARGYTGGRLDWWALDATVDPSAPPPPSGRSITVRGVPAPARFGGMPVPRFWEMEDARFDPGAIDAAPSDLGRLLLTSFATVYGNDWFVLPMRLPIGTLSRITQFVVTDVYGGIRALTAAGADVDGWNLFGLTDATTPLPVGVERPTTSWFYLAPTMPNGLEGRPVETVLLLRDEMANLAWAVEANVETAGGIVVDRHEASLAALPEPPPPGPVPRYQVDTVVPRHWYPLAPEQLADHESVRLRLVPLSRVDEADVPELPRGALLRDGEGTAGRLWLFEEEVPRAGAVVERRRQHARWHDASVHTWVARSKRTGGGEGSSGLRFDSVEP